MLTTTVCAALSAAGLAVAFLTAYRRRFAAAARIAAFALLPVGLAMAGLVELGADVGGAVGTWASHLVLDPTVWGGFGVLAVAVVLYVAGRAAAGRGGNRKERRAAARAERQAAPPGAGPASLGAGGQRGASRGSAAPQGGADDFSDVEAILRKHGI
jgi:hypothetical protein